MKKTVYIEWENGVHFEDEYVNGDDPDFSLSKVATIGFVVEDSEDYIAVAQNMDNDGNVDNVISIPVSVITRIEFLDIPEEEEEEDPFAVFKKEMPIGKFAEKLAELLGIKPPVPKSDSENVKDCFTCSHGGMYSMSKEPCRMCNDYDKWEAKK
jgi:hypothetical protein